MISSHSTFSHIQLASLIAVEYLVQMVRYVLGSPAIGYLANIGIGLRALFPCRAFQGRLHDPYDRTKADLGLQSLIHKAGCLHYPVLHA